MAEEDPFHSEAAREECESLVNSGSSWPKGDATHRGMDDFWRSIFLDYMTLDIEEDLHYPDASYEAAARLDKTLYTLINDDIFVDSRPAVAIILGLHLEDRGDEKGSIGLIEEFEALEDRVLRVAATRAVHTEEQIAAYVRTEVVWGKAKYPVKSLDTEPIVTSLPIRTAQRS